jgi:altronate hydrolase
MEKDKAELEEWAIRLHPEDDVAIARQELRPGLRLRVGEAEIEVRQAVAAGHKLALRRVAQGEAVRRYGQIIGFAKARIEPGDYVHKHNLGMESFEREFKAGEAKEPAPSAAPRASPSLHSGQVSSLHSGQVLSAVEEPRSFWGYPRRDGRTGTRNYVAVISTVNCSAHVTREIAHYFTQEKLRAYPNVDGVIALTHGYGCGVDFGSENYVFLQRTLAGMAGHPNVAGSVLVGLGCETNQPADLVRNYGLEERLPLYEQPLVIQESGGVRKTVERGIEVVERLLERANRCRRELRPVSELCLAVQCGGSDGWSGVTANPLVGLAADEVVRQGGMVVLAETPEIYGAEHLLTQRAASPEVAEMLMKQVRWWEEHTQRLGTQLDTNRSPGNEAGGLTTIYEKALGAVAKGGSSPLVGVLEYAERAEGKEPVPSLRSGLKFMNSPGNDWVSVTGQVAAGCNLVVFTTGRGSVFGFKPAPVIKLSTNTGLYERMQEDMDLNAGRLLEGERMEYLAEELFELILAVASGEQSKSEAQGIGEAEFSPWFLGGVL